MSPLNLCKQVWATVLMYNCATIIEMTLGNSYSYTWATNSYVCLQQYKKHNATPTTQSM
jgi:hypothetical protein